jgi:hypothetical protein
MKIQLSIISLLAVAALGAISTRASAQDGAATSDTLTITSTTANAPNVGTFRYPEDTEAAASVQTVFASTEIIGGPAPQAATLNANAGLTILVDPGVNFNATVAATLTAGDLFNATVLATAGLTLSNISDIAGILTSTTTTVNQVTTRNVTFGVVNDADPGLVGLVGFPGEPLHFFTEGAAGQNEFITAALNVNNGPVYNATFVSDVERVPDSGATISLLGLGLVGMAFLRRKLAV